jgi:hypothetical protein
MAEQIERINTYDDLLMFFEYSHLPGPLQEASAPFADLAHWMTRSLPNNSERRAALRKLLEAKDCAVRALLWASRNAARTAEPVIVNEVNVSESEG